jgi:GntR family transcriptional repressor for pyruvate dehydrogenase complex
VKELFTKHENTKKPAIVVRGILGLIESGELKPGDKLPIEVEIVRQTEISRTSVREALSALELMGVIKKVPGEGTFVTDKPQYLFQKFSNVDVIERLLEDTDKVNGSFEAHEARILLEPSVAILAARRAEQDQIEKLRVIIDEMEIAAQEKNLEAILELDSRFHLAMADAANNVVLLELMQTLLKKADIRMWSRFTEDCERFQHTVEVHRKIFDAVKEHDTKKAELLCYTHFFKNEDILP